MKASQEHVNHPDQAFRYLCFATDGRAGVWHRHRQVELTWIERGSGIRFVGDSAQPYGDDDLVLLGPNLPHLWLSAGAPGQARVVQFPRELIDSPALPEFAPLRSLVDRAARGLRVEGATRQAVAAAMRAMDAAAPLARLARLLQVFEALAEAGDDLKPLASAGWRSATGDGADRAAERRVQRVIQWIHGNLSQPLPVAEAAAIAHVAPESFSRFFRRETGKTYSRYVGDVRCSAACVRLRQTGLPVARIAHDCGYGTLSNFNRQFLRRTGTTPRAYRLAPAGAHRA